MPSNYDNIEYIDSASIMVAFLSGSLFGTSSYALTASYALNGGGSTSNSSSYALTASYTSTIPNAITAIDTLVSNYSASSYNKNHFLQCSSTLTVFYQILLIQL